MKTESLGMTQKEQVSENSVKRNGVWNGMAEILNVLLRQIWFFAVQDIESMRSRFSAELTANSFLSEDDLYRILKKQIEDDLDRDMEDFCNADDNYAPIFEKCVGEGTYDSYEIPIQ